MEENTALIEEWPRISFDAIAPSVNDEEEVEGGVARVFYKSFFALLRLPETMLSSFMTLLKTEPR